MWFSPSFSRAPSLWLSEPWVLWVPWARQLSLVQPLPWASMQEMISLGRQNLRGDGGVDPKGT